MGISDATQIMGSITADQQKILDKIASDQKNSPNKNGQTLDKDAFLKLLTTQLKYQDPLNPMDDKDSIAQMAQFSALEQSYNMSDQLAKSNVNGEAMLKLITEMNAGISNLVKAQVGQAGNSDPEISQQLSDIKAGNTDILNELIKLNKAFETYNNK
jgi:flagellar hook assembly protein FlgD